MAGDRTASLGPSGDRRAPTHPSIPSTSPQGSCQLPDKHLHLFLCPELPSPPSSYGRASSSDLGVITSSQRPPGVPTRSPGSAAAQATLAKRRLGGEDGLLMAGLRKVIGDSLWQWKVPAPRHSCGLLPTSPHLLPAHSWGLTCGIQAPLLRNSQRSGDTDPLEVTAPRGKQAPGDLLFLKLSCGESMTVPSCGKRWVGRCLHEFGGP